MVWLNNNHTNYTVPEGNFGGAMCMCPDCVKRRTATKKRRTLKMLDFYSNPQLPAIDDSITGIARYNLMRQYLEDGDVLEWANDSVLGWAIRKVTKRDVNHTSGVIRMVQYQDAPGDRVLTSEATEQGFVLNYLSRELERYTGKVYLLKLKPEHDNFRSKIVREQLGFIGKKYDFGGLIRNAFGRVSTDAKRFFCSEAIGYSLELSGITGPLHKALRPGEFEDLGLFQERIRIF